MKFRNLLLLPTLGGALLIGVCSWASERQLVINDEVYCDLTGQVMINTGGDLLVTLANLDDCVGLSSGLAVSPLVVVPDSVTAGESVQAIWSSAGADECTLTAPSGWSTGGSGLSGATTVSVPSSANAGTYSLGVICVSGSQTESSSSDITVAEADPGSPPSTPSLSISVEDSSAPGEVTLTWTPSSGASACEASSSPTVSNWNGSVSTSGSNNQTTLSGLSANSYTFRLRCSNSAGSSSWAQVSATIGSSTACSSRQPPSGWSQVTNGCNFRHGQGWVGDCSYWEGVWPGPFSEITGVTRRLGLAGRNGGNAQQYVAMEIDTHGMPASKTGRITVEHDTFATATGTLISISSCPGDFHSEAILAETGCYARQGPTAGGGSSFRWGGTASERDCKLESNRTYYLNIIPTNSPAGTHPDSIEPNEFSCGSSPCGLIYEPQG